MWNKNYGQINEHFRIVILKKLIELSAVDVQVSSLLWLLILIAAIHFFACVCVYVTYLEDKTRYPPHELLYFALKLYRYE